LDRRDGKRKRPKLKIVKTDPAVDKRKQDLYDKFIESQRQKPTCDCPVCKEDE
jgi:hypothetical protein